MLAEMCMYENVTGGKLEFRFIHFN